MDRIILVCIVMVVALSVAFNVRFFDSVLLVWWKLVLVAASS
jgi:hypothetical protein